MSTWLKILLGLALALPMSAYVVGSLVASADEPAPRDTITIDQSDRREPAGRPDAPEAGRGDDGRKDDDGDDADDADDGDDGDDGRDGDDDDSRVDAVQPEIERLDDRSGPGGGDDTNAGDDTADDRDDDSEDGGDDDGDGGDDD